MDKEKIENALKCLYVDMLDNEQIDLILNYISKLEKENRELQEKRDIEVNYFTSRMNDVGENVEKVYKIKDEKIEKLQKENKMLKDLLEQAQEDVKIWRDFAQNK